MASFSFGYESHTSINHVCLLHAETRFHLPSQELLLLDICIFRLFFLFFSWDFYFPHYFLRCQTSFLLTSQRATEGFMLVTSIGDGVSVLMDPHIVTRINAGYCLVVGVNCNSENSWKTLYCIIRVLSALALWLQITRQGGSDKIWLQHGKWRIWGIKSQDILASAASGPPSFIEVQ